MSDFSDINDFLASLQRSRQRGQSSSSSAPQHTNSPQVAAASFDINAWLQQEIHIAKTKNKAESSSNSSDDFQSDSSEGEDEIAADNSDAVASDESDDEEAGTEDEVAANDSNAVASEESDEEVAVPPSYNTQGRRSAKEAWQSAHMEPLTEGLKAVYQKCNSKCCLSGFCAESISGIELLRLRTAFHGENIASAPKDKERAARIMDYMKAARRDKDDNLVFKIGGKEVCTPTFLRFIGVSCSADMRDAPRQWTRLMKGYLQGVASDRLLNAKDLALDSGEGFTKKKVTVWIKILFVLTL